MKTISIFKTQIINAVINLGQLFLLFVASLYALGTLHDSVEKLDQTIIELQSKDELDNKTNRFIHDEIVSIKEQINTSIFRYQAFFAINVVVCLFFAWLFSSIIKKALRQISSKLSDSAHKTDTLSKTILQVSDSISKDTDEMSSSIDMSAESIENITAMTESNLSKSDTALAKSKVSQDLVKSGFSEMKNMEIAMSDIQNSSDEISAIIKTIDEIAFQTNILALNAAVEAARAGESGKGFAVVAEEVRTLAQRCSKAADDTTHKINEAKSRSDHGASLSQIVSTTLENILEASGEVNSLVEEIVSASNEQFNGIKDINSSIGQIKHSIEDKKAQAKEMTSTSSDLKNQSSNLNNMVHRLEELLEQRKPKNSEITLVTKKKTPKQSKLKKKIIPEIAAFSKPKEQADTNPKPIITPIPDEIKTSAEQDKDFEDF